SIVLVQAKNEPFASVCCIFIQPQQGTGFLAAARERTARPSHVTAGPSAMSNATSVVISVREHPLLRIAPFITRFPAPLEELETPVDILDLLRLDAETPLQREESVRRE